jgi:hypothetical protein
VTLTESYRRWQAEHVAQHMKRVEHGEAQWYIEEPFKVYTNPPPFQVVGAYRQRGIQEYQVKVAYIFIPGSDELGIRQYEVNLYQPVYRKAEKLMFSRGSMAWQNFLDYPRQIRIFDIRRNNGKVWLEANTYPEKLRGLNRAALFLSRKAAVV